MSRAGIAPEVLLQQIEAACPWALAPGYEGASPAATIARASAEVRPAWEVDPRALPYFRLLLAAHWLTVGSFCPTDVDARIRMHHWAEADEELLAASVAIVDEVAGWDPRPVSARVVFVEGEGPVSGHDGEWLSVRAGALGRALSLGAEPIALALTEAIEAELDRERRALARLAKGAPLEALRAVTAIAHNLGDLSRVVEVWPRSAAHDALRARFFRLGHEDASPEAVRRFGPELGRAGEINRRLTALENHRFLALRGPKALRRARALLLPIGPFFFGWGEFVARSPDLEASDRAEVLAGLLETHARGPTQEGCLRAIAGLHGKTPGGVEALAPDVPARMRKLVFQGAVRDALRVTEEAFTGRLAARFKKEVLAVGALGVLALALLAGCKGGEAPTPAPATATSPPAASSSAAPPLASSSAGRSPSSSSSAPPPTAAPRLAWALPKDGEDGARVVLVEDGVERAVARIEKGGKEIATMTIARASGRDAGAEVGRLDGWPVFAPSKTATALVAGPFEIEVASRTLDGAARRAWLARADVNVVTAMALGAR